MANEHPMKHPLFTALSVAVLSLAIATPASFAKVYSPSQFKTELAKKVGKKKGAAAINAASNFYKSALGDKKNKKNADKYASSINSILKKPVAVNLKGKSLTTLTSALLVGYFKGLKANPSDKTFNKALVTLSKQLTAANRSGSTGVATSNGLYSTIKNFFVGKGFSQSDIYDFYLSIDSSLKLPPPPVS